MTDDVSRRRFIRTGLIAGGAVALAGCSGSEDDQSTESEAASDTGEANSDGGGPTFPEIDDPPEAVYLPTHFEAMRHLDPVEAGAFELMPMVTYPHRFWNVTGEEVEPANPEGDDVHLMVAVRDPESGMVLPVGTGLQIQVGREGEPKTPYAPWPMLSQEMGFHFGDNIPLGDDGTYEVDVTVGAFDVELTGEFADRFDESATGTFRFEFDQEFRNEVVDEIEYLDEQYWGEPGALGPMSHGMGHDHGDEDHHDDFGHVDGHDHDDEDHGGHDHDDGGHGGHDHGTDYGGFGTYVRDSGETELPPTESLPGQLLGAPISGDAVIATTLFSADSRFVEEGQYLAVSPRTPYNRGMLPMMSIDLTVDREGETDSIVETQLTETMDHELGYHYAVRTAALDGVEFEDGDTLTLSFPTIPQVSRHRGYETAFTDMEPVELTVELS